MPTTPIGLCSRCDHTRPRARPRSVGAAAGLPGFGKLTLDSVFTRDYPVIQAVVVLVTAAYILINLAVDILDSVVNPRIRVGGNA